MPELPEVETMVRGLRPALVGNELTSVRVLDPFLLQGCTAAELEKKAAGSVVTEVLRRGKWVVISLRSPHGLIVIQPRMTGGFWLVPPAREDHVRLTFHVGEPGKIIWFCDTRRLGKIAWYPDREAADKAFANSHGPDALEISAKELADRLKKTNRGIKPTLMDQKVLAGIGNIYADETLFRSRIHPERVASQLKKAEVTHLHAAIQTVLTEAIQAEGSSFDAGYRTVLGLEGGFLAQNAMYGREGQPCPVCGALIIKAKIAGLIGRPTHYCWKCQPVKGGS